jgi:hypothetical protein
MSGKITMGFYREHRKLLLWKIERDRGDYHLRKWWQRLLLLLRQDYDALKDRRSK